MVEIEQNEKDKAEREGDSDPVCFELPERDDPVPAADRFKGSSGSRECHIRFVDISGTLQHCTSPLSACHDVRVEASPIG